MTSKFLALTFLVLAFSTCTAKVGELPEASPVVPDTDEKMTAQNPDLFTLALKYFPGEETAAPPERMYRLTRTQMDATAAALVPGLSGARAVTLLPRDPLQTNYEYAANLSFNPANFTPYTNWIAGVVATVRTHPTAVIDCTAAGNSESCLRTQAGQFVTRAFRGGATAETLTRYADFMVASAASVGVPDATADLVDLALSSPSFAFRTEVGADALTRLFHSAKRLENLAYALADAPPEALAVAPTSSVDSPEAVAKVVDAVLASPQGREKLARFFKAWLEVKEADEFTIDPTAFPEFTPAVAQAAVEETRSFLEHQLAGLAPTLKDLTASTHSYLTAPLAPIYGVAAGTPGARVDLDPTQRYGLFTQPAVLASHSGPTTTRLVKRGVFFTRKVMCLPLGNPPPGATNAVPPPSATVTERSRIESVTSVGSCAGCHTYINPFGFALENYDAIGRWRTLDNRQAINARVTVPFFDEGPLVTDTPVAALKGFTGSARFKQCFVRQLFRFYQGRDELPSDDPLLRKMFFHFANQDTQDLVGLLRDLATAPRFSSRAPKAP